MTSALTTLRPASIMVANWREKIWSDFGLIFLAKPAEENEALEPSSTSLIDWARRPFIRSCSRAAARSAAEISPASSAPCALIALYAKDAMLERGIGRAVQALEPSADRGSVVERLLKRLRADEGFGLIELAMAMVMLNIGILAIVAAFNSGAIALRRASLVANATAIADTYIERDRGFRNCQVYIDTAANSGIPGSGTTYQSDSAYS